MTLQSGVRLGPYEVVAPVGAGGMGEVYRARDTRLDRTVAIKVLPAALAANRSFLERFEREARAVSSLNHPHICALYDVGEQAGIHFIVMEMLDGESLAARLARAPMPIDEALRYAIQIAEALSRAHRQGIIHRDLKPGNVMLTRQGAKLLDFGLARVDPRGDAAMGATIAPTQTPLTGAGTILGTFQYMAPEQLEGRDTDARSDIFAFGALLYEMVTGRRAFSGKSQASLIASIMSSTPPPISSVQPITPPALDRVVKLCLAKDPEDRWQTAQDLAAELRWIAGGGSQTGAPAAVVSRRKSRERLAWTTAGVCALLAILAAGRLLTIGAPPAREPTRFLVAPPRGIRLSWPRMSPDGRTIAFVGIDAQAVATIWVRRLDSFDVVQLEGTENVGRPFWSPDSKYLAFFARGQLKKVAAAGGVPPQVLCERPGGADGSWSPAGVILFDGYAFDPIWRVSDSGGVPAVAMPPDPARKEVGASWPSFLPDGRHYLFVANGPNAPVAVKLGSLDSATSTFLMNVESRVEYSSGHIFYVSHQTLVARPFSPEKLAFTGDPFPLTDRMVMQNLGRADFSISATGDLSFMSDAPQASRLMWVDRAGREAGVVGGPGLYREMALSPDGNRLAVAIDSGSGGTAYDVWVIDLKRGAASRVTFGEVTEGFPVWSPDGSSLAFGATGSGAVLAAYRKAASGTGAEQLVYTDPAMITIPSDWSPNGKLLLLESQAATRDNSDLITVPVDTPGVATPFIKTPKPLMENHARFSPDGRWVAYESNESTHSEIYVQSFPPSEHRWQISTAGGQWPLWRGDAKEIFFTTADDTLYAVPVHLGVSTIDAGQPVKLFQQRLNHLGRSARGRWIVSRDGQRFLLNMLIEDQDVKGAQVVLNWAGGLTRK